MDAHPLALQQTDLCCQGYDFNLSAGLTLQVQWEEEFQKYQQSPEYRMVNRCSSFTGLSILREVSFTAHTCMDVQNGAPLAGTGADSCSACTEA